MNIQHIVDAMYETVENHRLDKGNYARYLWQNDKNNRVMGPNEYGCADAANIKYTIGKFDRDPEERAALLNALRAFQHEDGLFSEPTHHYIHCTAHCTAAIELYDAAPLRPFFAMSELKEVDNMIKFLKELDWEGDPWSGSHKGAGLFASFVLNNHATPEWQDAYFKWLTDNCDKKYGISVTGAIDSGKNPVSHYLNGWFHYLFNFNFARRTIPNAKQAVETCFDIYNTPEMQTKNFGKTIGFAEIDWIFVLHRCAIQEGYKVPEAKEYIRKFAKTYIDYLSSLDYEKHDGWNDLHMLFGCVCALAELQLVLKDEIKTDYPLKIVLDRRPFI